MAASIGPGTGRSVEVGGFRLAIYNHRGEMRALDDICSHRGANLGAGCLDGDHVMCPLHGWAFDVRTGACSTNPNRPVKVYPVRVENGEVLVGLPEPERDEEAATGGTGAKSVPSTADRQRADAP